MDKNKQSTEDRILTSAKKVFYQKGLKGARMQEIADDAEVNKAMLHYYYRSKEKLFDKVFEQSINRVTPVLLAVFAEEVPLEEKIAHLVEVFTELFLKEPYLSNFIVNELTQNPDKLYTSIFATEKGLIGEVIPVFNRLLSEGIEQGIVSDDIKPAELIVNIMSMCLLPIMAKPVLQQILDIDESRMDRFLRRRKKTVTQFVLAAIKPV